MQIVEVVTQVIQNLGFPIFVAIWLLLKTSKENREMKEVLTQLKNVIEIKIGEKE